MKYYTGLTIALLMCLSVACTQEKAPTDNSTAATADGSSETQKANAFFDASFDRMLSRQPMYESYLGIKKDYDKWNNISDTFAQGTINLVKTDLEYLKKNIDYNKLDAQAKLSYDIYVDNANQQIEAFPYRFLSLPVNQEDGLHTEVPTFLINVHSIDSLSDAKAYIARLSKVDQLFDQLVENLKMREDKGVIAPKFVYPKVLAACQNVISGAPFDKSKNNSPLRDDFIRKINALKDLSPENKEALLKEADSALLQSVKPGYDKLIAYLNGLEKKATTTVGAWSWPNGDEFYKMALRHTTTTNMTPEEVYQLGLKEVARIHGEIKEIMKKVHFKNDNIHDFLAFVTTDKQFYYPNTEAGRQAYLKQNTDYIETMKKHLDELFLTKPKADIQVKAVEKFREKSAGTAFYERPAPDGSRPGYFYANLYDMTQVPIYQIEALAYHEGIPGHHMQISIAQELQGLPKFRKYGDHTAYVEGWGLYCERIPKEIGFYKDPYQDFGRLSMELMRSARLVVDVGIHQKHWTREQAIQYFRDNTAEPPIECEHAIERYIVWPSQATAYKIGMNKILDLRQLAKDKLGDKFDIREFHDVVLTSGSLPLELLERNVNDWIAAKLKS